MVGGEVSGDRLWSLSMMVVVKWVDAGLMESELQQSI